ncbi:hypothetical protein ZIOFF_008134 [Zingiber officinale]|uniref:Phenylalanine--tRNA ligase beta subunit B1 domain-containing protein n=1 Tax=Zingiber officinale TaxID=94328 RepID=A0A8J5HVR2_ZINOF|nr:hypothetical protein ZIOFF_008134 [Zingiber officinale]
MWTHEATTTRISISLHQLLIIPSFLPSNAAKETTTSSSGAIATTTFGRVGVVSLVRPLIPLVSPLGEPLSDAIKKTVAMPTSSKLSVWFQEEQEAGDEDEEVIFKIGVAANRYDLLCLEGIAWALRIFIEKEASPLYTVTSVSPESILKMHVKPETSLIRPFVVCAVLRGIAFDEARYNIFIDLQDKLHQNICSAKIYSSWNTKRRTLVAIGTHDLDTIEGPFSYEALPPQEINFVPLKQSDIKLKKFLHIIENSPAYPMIYDRNR